MSTLHLCNTFFEWELSEPLPPSLEGAFSLHPIFLQLQFLPLLYASPTDGLLVTARPKKQVHNSIHLTSDSPSFKRLETWGYSKLAKEWADQREIPYVMPSWDLVKMVNSKTYSFSKSPLPSAKLVFEGDEIAPNTVLKSCYGTAGRGHIFFNSPKALAFCQKQWRKGLPVITEPWVKRIIDFSTQWFISQAGDIDFLGTTFCKTTSTGVHQSNIVGDKNMEKKFDPFIQKQKETVKNILKEMREMGYFGEVGFDAMIYDDNLLQPIVEINARKTMGWVALKFQQAHYPDKVVELAYLPAKKQFETDELTISDLLPEELGSLKFSRQVIITIH